MNHPFPLRVGVIGTGVGNLHLGAYQRTPGVEIHALAGLDEARVRELAAEYRIPHTAPDYAPLLADPAIDAVSICVPNFLHAPITIAALAAGKHVLVEKPLARTAAEGAAMLAAAEEHQRILMVAFSHRYRGDVQWAREYIQSGALGRIYYARAHWMRRSGIPHLGSWFGNKEQAGGGPLIDLGVHVLDMAMYLMGEPTPLTVSASTFAEFGPRGLKGRAATGGGPQPYEVEDLATAFIRLTGGATLLLEASWASHGPASDDFGVTLYGTEGGLDLLVHNYAHEHTLRVFTDIAGALVDLTPEPPRGGGHDVVIARFVAAIRQGAAAVPSAAEGLRRAVVLDACYDSAATGHEVEIPAAALPPTA